MSDAGEVRLDLQDGFVHDEVRVLADGREVARLSDVTTRTQISLARSLPLVIAAGDVRLTVVVTDVGLTQDITLPPTRPLWVGVSMTDARDRLEFRVQTERFGYV